jgi:hypothetical protein
MQNRYVGDIGDYVKLAILPQLAAGKRLGVAWWLVPDEGHNNDGGHREYVGKSDKWRHFDPELFDELSRINQKQERTVAGLEVYIPNAVYVRNYAPCQTHPWSQRPTARRNWLQNMKLQFKKCDLVFLDPDNGIAPNGLKETHKRAGKSVFISDIKELKESNQAMVVYHHLTRRKGGHKLELRHFAEKLRDSGFEVLGALRARPWSPRAFFILGADDRLWNDELCNRAQRISESWAGHIDWHPDESFRATA